MSDIGNSSGSAILVVHNIFTLSLFGGLIIVSSLHHYCIALLSKTFIFMYCMYVPKSELGM